MKHEVSVIIPVHNGEKYIEETLHSALGQQCPFSYEIIVVDDGSTDQTKNIVLDTSKSIQYTYQENRGVGAARNYGAHLSTGKYLAFLDADDLWHVTKLDKQVEAVKTHNAAMSFTYIQHFQCPRSTKSKTQSADPMPGKFSTTLLVEKKAFEMTGGFFETKQIGEFIDWYSRATALNFQEILLPEVLAYRRIHDHNMTVQQKESLNDYATILRAHLLRKKNSK